jgi:hypothetical protein
MDICLYYDADLLRAFCRDQRTDSGAGELELQIIRFDPYYYSVIFDGGDGAHNTTRGNDGVARLQIGQHLSLPLLLLLHGHKQQKIENNRDQNVGREESDRVCGRRLK